MKICLLVLVLGLPARPWVSIVAHRALEGTLAQALPGAPQSAPPPSNVAPLSHSQPTNPPAPDRYTLTPEKRAKAIAYSRATYILYFAGTALSIGIYLLLWRARVAVQFRNWARRMSPRHFIECLVFVPLFLATISLLEFPLEYYSGFVLEHRFDLSTQSFTSWLGDWGKSFAVTIVLGVFLVWLFYWVVRRSPRRWWLYFWLVSIPLVLAFIMAAPYIIDPLFFKFTPLGKNQPGLTTRIEGMLRHASLEIPRSRIFEMDASTKTKTLNAYVAGVGASKRVVVWDTTIRKMSEDETLLVLGHETGHYVLHHILKEFAFIELVVLALIYLGFIALNWLVERAGAPTGLDSMGDLASLPVAALALTVLGFLSSPVINGISRHYEHQADQFALEVTYGVVADPNASEARAFQVLGEEDLADPDPNPFIKFWLYSHPPLDDRIRFAASYKPWAEGKPLETVHPRR